MSSKDYKAIYNLQNKVLKQISALKHPFYLTGGTALGRFYLNHRLSEDLDFFVNDYKGFYEEVDKLITKLKLKFKIDSQKSVITEQFIRFYIIEETELKIEFVNDIAFRVTQPIEYCFGKIDNIRNILSNKLTALISRDEPKDVFDILCICKSYAFNWIEIINEAKEKHILNEIDIARRLREFPVELLNPVDWMIQKPDIYLIKPGLSDRIFSIA